MLGRLLHPLDRRQQTLLLTSLSFAGSSVAELWRFLPDEEIRGLQDKARKLEEIPKDKRVPLMVRELKGLMAFRSLKGLEGVEPSWLAAGFKGESPRIIAATLMHMPSSLTKQIIERLPDNVQKALPPRDKLRGVPLEVFKIIRARYEARFAPMPAEHDIERLAFSDLVSLSAKELIVVVRGLGADEIACAFVAVGKRALAEFLTKLPPADGEEVIAAVKRADVKDSMELKAAQAFLGKVLGNFHNTDELFQKAGLYRLARALTLQTPLSIRQITQRLPRAHGRLLLEYLERVRERDLDDAQLRRLRDLVVHAVANLSKRGKIDPRYGQVPQAFEAR